MQKEGASSSTIHHQISSSKPKLLTIIVVLIISILAIPVILPHITHPQMIYHIFLHIASVIIAVFLSTVSILSYKRSKSARILFMTFGFISLAIVELLYLFHATANIEEVIIPIVDVELSHVILLAMLTLFGIGVLKLNNK
jgi:hypothetical protein